jgi:hypothetical protein
MTDDIRLFEDKKSPGDWRVEYVGDDGSRFVNIFAGPRAEERARDYSKPCGPERCSRISLPTDTQRNSPTSQGNWGTRDRGLAL